MCCCGIALLLFYFSCNLPVQNSSVEWTVTTPGAGVTMRYTMPDSAAGEGLNGAVDVYVNGQFDQTVQVSSHWAWQYYVNQEPENTPHAFANTDYIAMRFDETHFKLHHALNVDDKIRWQSSQCIHVENQTSYAQHGLIYPSWWSAQWKLEPVQ